MTIVLHNCGMFVIAAQVCFLYACAGLYKVQGPSWANGTALHYVLNIDLFRPWPGLSQIIDGHYVLIAVVGYLTVLVQVAFPFVLFGRLKYPVLILLLGMHVNIAVLMGLPVFSGAMIVADAVFLPDRFYRSLGRLWRRTPGPQVSRQRSLARAGIRTRTTAVPTGRIEPDAGIQVHGGDKLTCGMRLGSFSVTLYLAGATVLLGLLWLRDNRVAAEVSASA